MAQDKNAEGTDVKRLTIAFPMTLHKKMTILATLLYKTKGDLVIS